MNKFFPALLAILALASCKPDDDETAGKGGTGALLVTPYHHTKLIRNCRIYIKYNASDYPGGGVFDDSAACTDVAGLPVARFSELKTGKYYLYGKGYDSLIAKEVDGGLPYHLHSADTVGVNVFVTESGH